MTLDFTGMNKINEGKTKVIYENPNDLKTVYMVFKDDITAGDGAKHDILTGKALTDWKTNKDIFEYLNNNGIKTHYVSSPEEKVSIVKKLDVKIDLEVVTRRVAAGSILKWGNIEEGTLFDPVITQFHYKDDMLHDPMLDQSYIDFIVRSKNGTEFSEMVDLNSKTFIVLEKAFANFGIQLIDFKLEYGIIDGQVTLIDEITGGSFRLWPYAKENPNLDQKNVMSELDSSGRLDKDLYRMGKDLSEVSDKFSKISEITSKFKDL